MSGPEGIAYLLRKGALMIAVLVALMFFALAIERAADHEARSQNPPTLNERITP
jgi:hypothetical protein